MENKYCVRIMNIVISKLKNVKYGKISFMNNGSINKDGMINKTDVVGIYGQNGSGKTAIVEALDIIRFILCGKSIPYKTYAGILSQDGDTMISTDFFVEKGLVKYKVSYQVWIRKSGKQAEPDAIEVYKEKLTYWSRGASWKTKRDIEFENPYYDSTDLLEQKELTVKSSHLKNLADIPFLCSMQNLALICAQRNTSVFFNILVMGNLKGLGNSDEVSALRDIICGIMQFGLVNFSVIKVNQLGTINNNQMIPINIHKETNESIMQACLPLSIAGTSEIPEVDYKKVQLAIDAINIAIRSIVPNLQIELEKKSELEKQDGTKYVEVEMYSNREGKRFLMRYESEGIKRIISILNYLISVFNDPGVCLVVDELDSGIFEYLLGELLGLMNREMKGQLIFTSHNLRVLEKLDSKNIICSTTNPDNRYIRLTGIEKNHNKRDFYIRAITVGGQKESLYDEDDLIAMGYAFRKAGASSEEVQITFSDEFERRLQNSTE